MTDYRMKAEVGRFKTTLTNKSEAQRRAERAWLFLVLAGNGVGILAILVAIVLSWWQAQ